MFWGLGQRAVQQTVQQIRLCTTDFNGVAPVQRCRKLGNPGEGCPQFFHLRRRLQLMQQL